MTEDITREISWDERRKTAKLRVTSNMEMSGEQVKREMDEIKKHITITEMRMKEVKKELDDISVADTPELKELARQLTLIGKLGQREKLETEMKMLEDKIKGLKTGKNFYGIIIDKVK